MWQLRGGALYHWRVCQYHGFRSGAGAQAFPPAADKRRKTDGTTPKAETKKEKFKVAAPIYIPTVLSGMATIACIISANLFNKVQQASIASAYALLSSSYKEYRDKLKELHGEDADLEVISNMETRRFTECPPSQITAR